MKALVKLQKGYGHVEVKEVPEPYPGPDEVKVAIRYCGICGTDVKIYHDEHAYYRPPMVLGHEFSGVVVEVGANVSNVSIGDEVVVGPPPVARNSLHGIPRDPWAGALRQGFEAEWGLTTYGGFTRYGVYDAQRVLRLPEGVDVESAALTEPLSVCIHGVLGKASVHCTDVVVVSGPGPIGLLTAQLAKAEGGFVILLGISGDEKRLALAEELGVDMAINVQEQDPLPIVLRLTHGSGADAVFECAGAAASVSRCIELARRGAHYVQIGTSMKIMDIDFTQMAYKELTAAGSFGASRIDWERGLKLLDTGKVKAKPLVSHKVPLPKWQEAFAIADRREGVKVLIYPEPA